MKKPQRLTILGLMSALLASSVMSSAALAAGDTARTNTNANADANANTTANTNATATTGTNANTRTGATAAAEADGMENNAYLTLSGTVASISDDDEFMLNYGGGQVKVDTNDAWANLFSSDANNATKALAVGDQVIITGKVDDNWFTQKEIDAYSLRHSRGGQVFNYEPANRDANAPDIAQMDMTPTEEGQIRLTGTISRVMNDSRYEMRYGANQSAMIQLDTTGLTGGKDQTFRVGDRVTVSGELDDTLFNEREINVDTIRKVDTRG